MHDCVGGILVRGGRVLLGLRSADARWLAGAWDVFGGHVEAGESAEQALVRELREELGVDATGWRAVGEIAGERPERWRLRVFAVHAWGGEPANLQPREHAALRWCTLADAQALLAPAHAGFAALLQTAVAAAATAARAAEPPGGEDGGPERGRATARVPKGPLPG